MTTIANNPFGGDRQRAIDWSINKQLAKVHDNLIAKCRNIEEATYVTCALTHTLTTMLFKTMSACMDQQQAKAAFKVALDAVLCEHGMSIKIHEFQ